ncbi:hypothetical protein H8S95_06275 [Pontibacter sp. KCTC 32443]|uniref:hypothetical protein n=1 Tax=Pontibacter TaxID=323449 RepID=UPI00164E0867|nr:MULTISPECIES: hypothetical protein [Pontibacter]MBC5773662.1 hypothetical protein [Pontibacter sp. KCTC 32443]
MENENKQNQNNNSKKSEGKQSDSNESVLKLLHPHDMSKTVESAMHVLQGNHEKLPDLLQDIGNIIVRASRRLTTTQLILAAGALTIGAVLLARQNADEFEYSGD